MQEGLHPREHTAEENLRLTATIVCPPWPMVISDSINSIAYRNEIKSWTESKNFETTFTGLKGTVAWDGI
jgi:hypothetical protein